MIQTMKRSCLPVLALCCMLTCVDCRAVENVPQTSAQAFVLIDAESGRILAEKNMEEELAIASTTKIMTALVALERGELSDIVTVKGSHLKEGSSMYLRAGETLTLEVLLYGLLLPSGNDAAECIADHCGAGVDAFVARMNEKAAELGMEHTAFANPSGLDAAGHYSCALDMARLAAYAMQQPVFKRIAATRSASVGERSFSNHNKLLGLVEGCTGLKTGYTDAAGRTLVTCCERNGMQLIAVTLNDRNDWADHTALYEYGFSVYSRTTAVTRGEEYMLAPLRGGVKTSMPLAAKESFFYPLLAEEELTVSARLDEELCAPLTAGQSVGEILIALDGTELGRVPLICTESAAPAEKKMGMLERLFGLFA